MAGISALCYITKGWFAEQHEIRQGKFFFCFFFREPPFADVLYELLPRLTCELNQQPMGNIPCVWCVRVQIWDQWSSSCACRLVIGCF